MEREISVDPLLIRESGKDIDLEAREPSFKSFFKGLAKIFIRELVDTEVHNIERDDTFMEDFD